MDAYGNLSIGIAKATNLAIQHVSRSASRRSVRYFSITAVSDARPATQQSAFPYEAMRSNRTSHENVIVMLVTLRSVRARRGYLVCVLSHRPSTCAAPQRPLGERIVGLGY